MPLITIREHAGPNGANAVVSFDHGPEHPATIADPFSTQEEADLEWYFEDYLRFPFVEQVRFQQVAACIPAYGEALFQQVFADNKAQRAYGLALDQGLENLTIEIKGSPEFHHLHWEALKDPELPRAFALDCPVLRRNTTPPSIETKPRPGDTLRVLLVTSRPFGDRDVAYRTISRPLVEALENARLPVDIHILRPGSYRALVAHLQETRDRHGAGWYHIAHFDAHGAVLGHDQFQAMDQQAPDGRYLFRGRYGRGDIQPYDGLKGFLFLDGDADRADPVADRELADLLTGHGIHAVVLNACQSAKQVSEQLGNSGESSLGARLMQAGVQWVLAMGYSVTVSAAERLMTALYRRLFDGDQLTAALRRARLELHHDKARRVYYDQQVELEDWLLPVVYENRPLALSLAAADAAALAQRLARRAGQYRAPRVEYGFQGRDLDILRIERRLLADPILLLRGMAGAGKSTLLRHLAQWWQTTHFVEQVWYFSYENSAWTLEQLLHALALGEAERPGLLDEGERQLWHSLPAASQQILLVERLRGQRHLLILDNLESVTGAHLAIPNTLDAEQQARLRAFIDRLAGGHSLILLGSRGPEDWLIGDTPRRVYELAGLDPEAASTLAERVLERRGVERYRTDPDLERLLKLLAGFPLAIEVVLTNLADQTPAEVLAALTEGDAGLDLGKAVDKSASLLRCIEYSHGRLSPGAQDLLACLAPFRGVFFLNLIEPYTEQLRQQPALANLPFERWPEVLREAADWGLVTAHEVDGYLRLQPTLPWFLRARLADGGLEEAILTAFRETMTQFGIALAGLFLSPISDETQQGLLSVQLEYENLLHALKLALNVHATFAPLSGPLTMFLDAIHDEAKGLELAMWLMARLEEWPQGTLSGDLAPNFICAVDDVGKRFLRQKRFSDAESAYTKAMNIISADKSLPAEFAIKAMASVLHQLGRVAEEQRSWPRAGVHYRRALECSIECGDRQSQAKHHHQLGIIAQEQEIWHEAEEHYKEAMRLAFEIKDIRIAARTCHQLGLVARLQKHYSDAEEYLSKAEGLKLELNDLYSLAHTLQEQGSVASDQGRWDIAENKFCTALGIFIEYKDRHAQAGIYKPLGMIALERGQLSQAEDYSRKAHAIFLEFGDRYEQANTHYQLGLIAQEESQWPKAEIEYREALGIYIEFDDRHSQGGAYYHLGTVIEERNGPAEAMACYVKALAICREVDDRHNGITCVDALSRLHGSHPKLFVPEHMTKDLNISMETALALLALPIGEPS